MTSFNFTYIDNSNERSNVGLTVVELDETNFDAIETLGLNLQTGINGVTLAAPASKTLVASKLPFPYTIPTDVNANREVAVMFTLQVPGSPNQKARVSIPAPDLSKFPFVDLQSDIAVAPFGTLNIDLQGCIDAMEAAAVHPISSAAMEVIRMEKVGRNL